MDETVKMTKKYYNMKILRVNLIICLEFGKVRNKFTVSGSCGQPRMDDGAIITEHRFLIFINDFPQKYFPNTFHLQKQMQ